MPSSSRNVRMRPFSRLIIFALGIVLLFPAASISHAPATDTPAKLPADDKKAEPPSTIIESLETKIRFENDGKYLLETELRAKVQSESAVRENGVLVFSYMASFETLEIQYVRVRKPSGEAVETDLNTVQDLTSEVTRSAPMYTDEHEKHIAVRGLSAGDKIEYRITKKTTQPIAPGQFWFTYDFDKNSIVISQQFEINIPKDRQVRISSSEYKQATRDEGDRRIVTIQSSNLAIAPKPDKWEIALKGPQPPDVQISSFTSWNEVA